MGMLGSKWDDVKEMNKENNKKDNNDFKKHNIFFNWGNKNEHVIRLIGSFVFGQTHWIGKSAFGNNKVDIINPDAITDKRLPMKIACTDWDIATESFDGHECPICRLRKAADALLNNSEGVEECHKQEWKAVRDKCRCGAVYLFKCIDRDNPYVAEGEKGAKIIQMPAELVEAIAALDKQLNDTDLSSEKDGIDILIKRELPSTGKGRTKYSAVPVFDGVKIRQTPLTAEEIASAEAIDLTKFVGKKFASDVIEAEFTPIAQQIIGSVSESGEDIPF